MYAAMGEPLFYISYSNASEMIALAELAGGKAPRVWNRELSDGRKLVKAMICAFHACPMLET